MSKRKPIVNDIIYELDHEDLDSSSGDEQVDPKKARASPGQEAAITINDSIDNENGVEVVDVDSSDDAVTLLSPASKSENGGKTPPKEIDKEDCTLIEEKIVTIEIDHDGSKDLSADDLLAVDEDIVVDSPGSPASNLVIGCANRVPLITVMFNDKRIARNYKQKIKDFMLKLIKLHDEEPLVGSDEETDLELDIWPEDLANEPEVDVEKIEEEDNLFFIDTDPNFNDRVEVPQYSQATQILSDEVPKVMSPPPMRRGPTCFNCDGAHQLRECTLPRNMARIQSMRKMVNANRVGRYHVEDDQKYGHLIPGRISGALRHAMGLHRDELPLYIYRMRLLGYPPGWLEEAKISHSGITMFDSSGTAIQDPEDEDGELCEPGSKDKFDIKKILDFPGFNVPASSRYKEDAHRYNLPPLSEQDSKLNMLQVLAPNAMKAYKRKKLTFFPSELLNNSAPEGHAEMELDDGDEEPAFPSVPPLPDEPPPPPPPDAPPPPPPGSPPPLPPGDKTSEKSKDTMAEEDADETLDIQLDDIPLPPVEVVSDDDGEIPSSSDRDSPTLDDLEQKKQLLLAALEGSTSTPDTPETTTEKPVDSDTPMAVPSISTTDKPLEDTPISGPSSSKNQDRPGEVDPDPTSGPSSSKTQDRSSEVNPDTPITPLSKTGHVKTTLYGTPVMNIASPYEKLPSDVKFAKDICDVINFENLPDYTGKYEKICSLLKRVKGEVDRIHDS